MACHTVRVTLSLGVRKRRCVHESKSTNSVLEHQTASMVWTTPGTIPAWHASPTATDGDDAVGGGGGGGLGGGGGGGLGANGDGFGRSSGSSPAGPAHPFHARLPQKPYTVSVLGRESKSLVAVQ